VSHNENLPAIKPLEPGYLVSGASPSDNALAAARARRHEQFLALLMQKDPVARSTVPKSSQELPPDSEMPPSEPNQTNAVGPVLRAELPPARISAPSPSPSSTIRPRTKIADLDDNDAPAAPLRTNPISRSLTETPLVTWHEPLSVDRLTEERHYLTTAAVMSRQVSVTGGPNSLNALFPAVAFGAPSSPSYYYGSKYTLNPTRSTVAMLGEIGTTVMTMRHPRVVVAAISSSRKEIPETVTFVIEDLVHRGVPRNVISIHLVLLHSPVSAADAFDRRSVSISIETDGSDRDQTLRELSGSLLQIR